MSLTGHAPFDNTLQTTNIWLKELAHQLGHEQEYQYAYHALRAVLHALRDRMPIEKVKSTLPADIRSLWD